MKINILFLVFCFFLSNTAASMMELERNSLPEVVQKSLQELESIENLNFNSVESFNQSEHTLIQAAGPGLHYWIRTAFSKVWQNEKMTSMPLSEQLKFKISLPKKRAILSTTFSLNRNIWRHGFYNGQLCV